MKNKNKNGLINLEGILVGSGRGQDKRSRDVVSSMVRDNKENHYHIVTPFGSDGRKMDDEGVGNPFAESLRSRIESNLGGRVKIKMRKYDASKIGELEIDIKFPTYLSVSYSFLEDATK